MYQHELFVPFYWGDAAGIMFFGHTFSIAHQAYENFVVNSLSTPWEEWFHNKEWIIPIKQTEATYFYPILPGKNCLVKMEIAEIRTSSFTIHYHLFQDEVECCSVKTVHVFCKRSNHQKQDIPADIKVKLVKTG